MKIDDVEETGNAFEDIVNEVHYWSGISKEIIEFAISDQDIT